MNPVSLIVLFEILFLAAIKIVADIHPLKTVHLKLFESGCNNILSKSTFVYLKFTETVKFSEEIFKNQTNKGIIYFYNDLLRSKLPLL